MYIGNVDELRLRIRVKSQCQTVKTALAPRIKTDLAWTPVRYHHQTQVPLNTVAQHLQVIHHLCLVSQPIKLIQRNSHTPTTLPNELLQPRQYLVYRTTLPRRRITHLNQQLRKERRPGVVLPTVDVYRHSRALILQPIKHMPHTGRLPDTSRSMNQQILRSLLPRQRLHRLNNPVSLTIATHRLLRREVLRQMGFRAQYPRRRGIVKHSSPPRSQTPEA